MGLGLGLGSRLGEPLEGVAPDVGPVGLVARRGVVHVDDARGALGVGAVEAALTLAQAAPAQG